MLDPPGAATGLRRHLHRLENVAEERDVDRGDAHLGALVRHGPDRRAGGDGHWPELDVVLQPVRGEDLQIFGGPLGECPLERVAAGRLPAPRELPAAEQLLAPRGRRRRVETRELLHRELHSLVVSPFDASQEVLLSAEEDLRAAALEDADARGGGLPGGGASREAGVAARAGRRAREKGRGGGERGHAGVVEMWIKLIRELFGHVVDGSEGKFSRDDRSSSSRPAPTTTRHDFATTPSPRLA